MNPPGGLRTTDSRDVVRLGHLCVDAVTEAEVLDHVAVEIRAGRGGTIVTPNLDIWHRTRHDPHLRRMVAECDLIVADGMPLVWSARLAGRPIPERVTGSGLVESLAARGSVEGWSVFIIGGGSEETSTRAAAVFGAKYPGLRVAGAVTPPFGFDKDPDQLAALVTQVEATGADLVLVGLGFPKQEVLARTLAARMPGSWFLGCGAGVQMAAGMTKRPPAWVQAAGGEWVYRLAQDPRRLARRYLVDDLRAVMVLLGGAVATRLRKR